MSTRITSSLLEAWPEQTPDLELKLVPRPHFPKAEKIQVRATAPQADAISLFAFSKLFVGLKLIVCKCLDSEHDRYIFETFSTSGF